MSKMFPNTILAVNKWPKIFKISSQWRNFTKSGHTAHSVSWVVRGRHVSLCNSLIQELNGFLPHAENALKCCLCYSTWFMVGYRCKVFKIFVAGRQSKMKANVFLVMQKWNQSEFIVTEYVENLEQGWNNFSLLITSVYSND